MSWNDWVADVSLGGDSEFPLIPEDIYDAMIKDISEPKKEPPSKYHPNGRTVFTIDWELVSDSLPEGTTIRQWVNYPPGVRTGVLSEKSALYLVMKALNLISETGSFRLDLESWQGMEARVIVDHYVGDKGDKRHRVGDLKPKRKPLATTAAKAATKPSLRARLEGDDEE